jgi:hypothetical protein
LRRLFQTAYALTWGVRKALSFNLRCLTCQRCLDRSLLLLQLRC